MSLHESSLNPQAATCQSFKAACRRGYRSDSPATRVDLHSPTSWLASRQYMTDYCNRNPDWLFAAALRKKKFHWELKKIRLLPKKFIRTMGYSVEITQGDCAFSPERCEEARVQYLWQIKKLRAEWVIALFSACN